MSLFVSLQMCVLFKGCVQAIVLNERHCMLTVDETPVREEFALSLPFTHSYELQPQRSSD